MPHISNAVKKLTGTDQPCRMRADMRDSIDPVRNLPPPVDLDSLETQCWDLITASMAAQGMLGRYDALAIVPATMALAQMLRARQEGKLRGVYISQASKQLEGLGLTPLGRIKLGIEVHKDEPSLLDELKAEFGTG